MFSNLKEQINQFRRWANTYPIEQRSGEWECSYNGWNLLYDSFTKFLQACPVEKWNQEIIQDVLYIIARDNETEIMISDLALDTNRLLFIANAAISSSERDAKWQIAAKLGKLSSNLQDAESLLLKFVEDDEEYVRRIAFMSLGSIGSAHVEQLAEQIWNREEEWQEYQRMAVLDALLKVNSPQLKEYLVKAVEDGRQYLVAYSRKIESEL
ncbi:MAG TPA: HEAT repeat domain-containing protein [Pyrinomonadaceae bacterium]|jgi:HEAT repeat protein